MQVQRRIIVEYDVTMSTGEIEFLRELVECAVTGKQETSADIAMRKSILKALTPPTPGCGGGQQ